MSWQSTFVLALLCGAQVAHSIPALTGYDNSVTLSDEMFVLYWTHSGDNILFGFVANTTGWAAIAWGGGLNGTGADVIIASVGDSTASDYFMKVKSANTSACPNALCPDAAYGCNSDVTNSSVAYSEPWLTVTFSIPVNETESDMCDRAIRAGSFPVEWAVGPGFISDDSVQLHEFAGNSNITIYNFTASKDSSSSGCTGTSCSSCTSDDDCVWCSDDNSCSDGDPNGLTITVPANCNNWYWGQCSISGEALGTPYTYAILVGIAVLIAVCIIVLVITIIVKLCQRHSQNKEHEMEEY